MWKLTQYTLSIIYVVDSLSFTQQLLFDCRTLSFIVTQQQFRLTLNVCILIMKLFDVKMRLVYCNDIIYMHITFPSLQIMFRLSFNLFLETVKAHYDINGMFKFYTYT